MYENNCIMHRNNKQWKMKHYQNLLSLKHQRLLPVVFAGSKACRDSTVPNCWQSLTVLFCSREEGCQQAGSASGQLHILHQDGCAWGMSPATGVTWWGHISGKVLAGYTHSITYERGQAGTATPQAVIHWVHPEVQTYMSKWYLHLQFAFPCPALQVEIYMSPLWDHSYD